LRRYKVS